MKKAFLIIAALGLLAMTACKKDDPDVPNNDQTVTASMDYSLTTTDTILHYYHITAYYRDNNNQSIAEIITNTNWTKHFDNCGTMASLRFVYTLRDDVDTSYSDTNWLYDLDGEARIDLNQEAELRYYKSDAIIPSEAKSIRMSKPTLMIEKAHWDFVTEQLNDFGASLESVNIQ